MESSPITDQSATAGLFQDLLAAATAATNPLLRGDTELIDDSPTEPTVEPTTENASLDATPVASTPRRSSARTSKAPEATPADAPVASPAASPTKTVKRKATVATPRRNAPAPSAQPAPLGDEVAALRAEIIAYKALIQDCADNTKATQIQVNEVAYLAKDAQNELMKLQVVHDKVKELSRSDKVIQATLVGEVKPILDGFSAFMAETRTRLNKIERTERPADGPEKRRRVDSPPPSLAVTPMHVAPMPVAAAAAPASFLFNTPHAQPALAATAPFTFTAPATQFANTFPRPQATRARTVHYIKFGPIDTNGCAPLFVVQQMIEGLTNGAMFSKLIKHATVFPGANNFILATLYSHEHAAGVCHAWNTTRPAAYATITAEPAGQGQGN